jgi:hypothetical protein
MGGPGFADLLLFVVVAAGLWVCGVGLLALDAETDADDRAEPDVQRDALVRIATTTRVPVSFAPSDSADEERLTA